ncbi:MAG: outer membrane protein assembly factor BamE [Alphaproteobacteria bacterium]|nr:outer membrane protein assembly factor BamE [Alphaproteobacteria bacterium]
MSTPKIIITGFMFLALSACSTDKTEEWFVTHNGNMPSEERISQISKGDSQDKVMQILGAPSTVISFDKNTWLYMSSDIKRVAFFAPSEVKRDVLTIRFDDKGEVIEVSRLNKDCGNEVKINSDETEAPGENLGFFRKYFGGVGQYNPLSGMGK